MKRSARRSSATASMSVRSQALTAAVPTVCSIKSIRARLVLPPADQKDSAIEAAAQLGEELQPPHIRPILVRMRGADAEHDPRPQMRFVPFIDVGERRGGHRQIRLRRRQRHVHGRHQRDEPIDRLIVEMGLVDAGIGDEKSLRPETKPDALGDAGERRGDRRPNGAIEYPYLLKAAAPQPRDEQEQIEPAAQLRAGMLEIKRFGDARLGREQFLRAARRRRQERHRGPGDAVAMARTNGRCQMTSPMPGLTWMTALAVTLIAASKVAICPF